MTSPWNDPPPDPRQEGAADRPGGAPRDLNGGVAGPPPPGGPSFLAGPPSYGGGSYGPPPQAAPYGFPGGLPVAPPRPGPLGTAVVLMWIGAGLALVNALSTFLFIDDIRTQVEDQRRDSGAQLTDSTIDAAVSIGIAVGVVSGLITIGLWIWMAVKNGQGRSWARVTATVFGGLGILFSGLGLVGSGIGAESTPLSVGSSALNLLLAIATLIMLWNSQNAEYYRANS